MSSSLLHQAVELAQAGQREQARQLILQFLQSQPNEEVAWLWLASVAADQAEYVRALNEVLRIHPDNQRARSLLDDYYQQQAPPPLPVPSSAGSWIDSSYARPPAQPDDQWVAAPRYEQPTPGYAQIPPVQPVYIERERVIEKQRGRGCLGCMPGGCLALSGCSGCGGCGPGCLLALLILVVLPVLACGALSYSTTSLGPFDLILGVLPGEFGRKTIEIQTGDYRETQEQNFTITASVPRSWMLIDPDDPAWEVLAEMSDQAMPFAQENRTWADEANTADQRPILLDMSYPYLSEGGNLIKLELAGQPEAGDYRCQGTSAVSDQKTYAYSNGFCGYRVDRVEPYTGGAVFKTIDPPAQMRTVTFYTPMTDKLALKWTLTLPEDTVYAWLREDIDVMIGSIAIAQ